MREAGEQEIDFEAPAPTVYLVELLDWEEKEKEEEEMKEEGDEGEGEEDGRFVQVGAKELRRYKGRSVSRMTIKSKLKTIGARQGSVRSC
eukprot:2907417-Rhodomonas_salina.1